MNEIISIILTVFGAVTIFFVSKWNRWFFNYKSVTKVPLAFSRIPLLYWILPLTLFLIIYIFGSLPFVILLLSFGIPMELGQLIVKHQYIAEMTSFISENDELPFSEAKSKAIIIERSSKLTYKH